MSKDIKKIIKPLVKECLLELFAEMKLESIVEGVVNKQQLTNQSTAVIVENRQQQVQQPIRQKPNKRSLMEAIGVNENTWNDVYADTLKHGNSILKDSGGASTPTAPNYDDTESVPEAVLENAGLMKDYSRFLK